ncbi:MAG: ATP phosphoribosyltransferase [Acutalibacteraceae bacterium]
MISIALPKGRLGNKAYKLLEQSGYTVSELMDESRKLVFENPESGVRYFLVKPSDVPIYVEYGAADIGIVGKDILLESGADVYELLDLGIGKCTMCVAAKEDYAEDNSRPVVVATKFPNIARKYYMDTNREIEVIKLYGSIELAPLLGMSDVIVDIVETGTTLKENHLKVFERIFPVSARLIAGKAAYKFKEKEINEIVKRLGEVKL